MNADKRVRISKIAGFACVGVALLNATFAVLAMVAEKNWHKGTPGIAIAGSLVAIGVVCLSRGQRRPPPDD